jgi:hypothetical protein
MSVKVDSGLRRARMRINARKILRGARIKPQPLIFEPDHKNIATLISFLVTIFIGLGAGWLAGSVLSSTFKPTPVVEDAQAKIETGRPTSLNSASNNSIAEAGRVEQAMAQPQSIEERGDTGGAKRRVQRRGGSRRAYVTVRGGESIPVAVIKGKPLKKAFKQFRRVRFW